MSNPTSRQSEIPNIANQYRPRWSRFPERIALTVERPVNRLIGNRQLNPFYHTGSISVFLFAVVGLTGFYIYLFYQYGFEASFNAVQTRIEEPFLARTMRAIHRYASGALAVTIFLHALRILFMRRFKGPRSFAWLTGVLLVVILWLAGVTGYWLVWDDQAQLITESVTGLFPAVETTFLRVQLNGNSWWVMGLILLVHVLLFVVSGVFVWLHVRHVKQPRWLPELVWMGGAGVVLLLMGVLLPVGSADSASFFELPGRIRIDPLFLFFIPFNGTLLGGLIWILVGGVLLWAIALPYWKRNEQREVVQIDQASCTGCTKCASDCPYNALEMVERDDDSGFQLLAVVDESKCVGCGICVGSCDTFLAMAVGERSVDDAWERVEAAIEAMPERAQSKLILTCERHASLLDLENDALPMIVPFSCTGAIPPHILPKALAMGVAEVEVVGCPPYDCVNRLGNMFEEQRVTNERVPRLRKRHDDDPITAAWLPPDEFVQTLPLTVLNGVDAEGEDSFLERRAMFDWLTPRNFVVGFVLLAFVLAAQVWLTGLPFTPQGQEMARVDLVVDHLSNGMRPPFVGNEEVRVELLADGVQVWEVGVDSADFYTNYRLHERILLDPGATHIQLRWHDNGIQYTFYDNLTDTQSVSAVEPGQIIVIHDIAGY